MSKTYILSIDPANKSLAVSFFSYDNLYKDKINNELEFITNNTLKNIDNILNNVFNFMLLEVIDLLPDKKVQTTDILTRTLLFKKAIYMINNKMMRYINEYKIDKIIVCIEYQPVFNDKSKTIYNQLIYEYSYDPLYEIQIMSPALKNQIYFNKNLVHKEFIKKYNSGYRANKIHSKENFLYVLKIFNMLEKIKKIKTKNLDDIADTFLQGIAYLKFNAKLF